MRRRSVTDLGQLGLGFRQLGAFGGRVVPGGQPGGHIGALPGDKDRLVGRGLTIDHDRFRLGGLALARIAGAQVMRQQGILGIQRRFALGQRLALAPVRPIAVSQGVMLLREVGQHAIAMFTGQRLAAQGTGGRIRGLEHLDLLVQRLPVGLDAIVLGPQRGRPLTDFAQLGRDRIAPGLLLGHVRQDRLRCRQRLRLLLARRDPATELGLAVGQPAILGLQRQPGLIHGQPRPVDAFAQLGVTEQAGVPRGIFGARPR